MYLEFEAPVYCWGVNGKASIIKVIELGTIVVKYGIYFKIITK